MIHVVYTKKAINFLKRLLPKKYITIFYMFLNDLVKNSRNLMELFNSTNYTMRKVARPLCTCSLRNFPKVKATV